VSKAHSVRFTKIIAALTNADIKIEGIGHDGEIAEYINLDLDTLWIYVWAGDPMIYLKAASENGEIKTVLKTDNLDKILAEIYLLQNELSLP
jgi:hypothetical protein